MRRERRALKGETGPKVRMERDDKVTEKGMGGGGTNQKPEGGERKGAGTGSCGPRGDRAPGPGR